MSCECDGCQNACKHFPGKFLPGEAEAAAEILGIPYEEFFKEYLTATRDTYQAYALRPRMKLETGGTIKRDYSFKERSACVFFEKGKCKIHDVKPAECLSLICAGKAGEKSHFNPLLKLERIIEAWIDAGDPLSPPMEFPGLELTSTQLRGILGNGQTNRRSNGDRSDGSTGNAE